MRKYIDNILEKALIFIMGIMVINVLWQVFSRFILQSSSSWTEELARFLLIWVGLLGAAYTTGQRMHLAIDLLPQYLSGKSARRLNRIIQSMVVLFAFFAMVIGGIRLVYLTLILEQTSAALSVPMGVIYMAIPISGILIIYYSMLNFNMEVE